MALDIGTRLGPYEIKTLIGAGGMGEVYQARDTRLDRTVAIKLLPPERSTDPERRARFEREAHTIAALNHPHICTLHDIGQHDGTTYLVMEHLAGETLAQRLRKGALPVPQALEIGVQVAEALDAAHKHGIVHRDLKPANVMLVTSGGTGQGSPHAKLLDFGLAKLREPEISAPVDASTRTLTGSLTEAGEVLGTRPYMAPEQVEGKATDARTDLCGLGCMLYEMVTGRPAFTGDSVASITAAILEREPEPLATRQPLTPPALDHVVRKCLAKAPDARWQSAADVADELRWVGQSTGTQPTAARPSGRRRSWAALAFWALSPAGGVLVGALAVWRFGLPGQATTRGTAVLPVARVAVVLSSETPFWIDPQGFPASFALSPDGATIAYTCVRGDGTQICLRHLDRSDVSPITGTEGGRHPVFAPDGNRVLFCVAERATFCQGGSALATLNLADGRVDTLGTIPGDNEILSLAWDTDGAILLDGADAIWSLSSSGGPAAPIVRVNHSRGELHYYYPAWLADRQRMIFSVFRAEQGRQRAEVRVLTVSTGEQRVLVEDAGGARYLPTGHLLYWQGSDRWKPVVAPFNATRLALGEPIPLSERVRVLNFPALAVSRGGGLLYLPAEADRVLTWVDRQRRSVPALSRRDAWGAPQLSPDGRRVAVEVRPDGEPPVIAVVGLDRGEVQRIAHGLDPLWTPDGKRITFSSSSADSIAWRSADGTESAQVLMQPQPGFFRVFGDGSWSPDGRVLAFSVWSEAGFEIWTLSKQGASWVPQRFAGGLAPRFSPDGRWIAHVSGPTRASQVWLRPYPAATPPIQVSVDGGYDAAWSPDSREISYRRFDTFFAVSLSLASTPSISVPRTLFAGPYLDSVNAHAYSVARDGQRFLVVQTGDEEGAPRRLHLVQNWFEELKEKVPSGTR